MGGAQTVARCKRGTRAALLPKRVTIKAKKGRISTETGRSTCHSRERRLPRAWAAGSA